MCDGTHAEQLPIRYKIRCKLLLTTHQLLLTLSSHRPRILSRPNLTNFIAATPPSKKQNSPACKIFSSLLQQSAPPQPQNRPNSRKTKLQSRFAICTLSAPQVHQKCTMAAPKCTSSAPQLPQSSTSQQPFPQVFAPLLHLLHCPSTTRRQPSAHCPLTTDH